MAEDLIVALGIDDQLNVGDDVDLVRPATLAMNDAIGWVEVHTGHLLRLRSITETLSSFDATLKAWPIAPTARASVSYGILGVTPVLIDNVPVIVSRRPACLARPTALAAWPRLDIGAEVQVTVDAGYATADLIPGNLRRAVLVLAAAYDSDREGGDILAAAEKSARSLCSPFRMRRL